MFCVWCGWYGYLENKEICGCGVKGVGMILDYVIVGVGLVGCVLVYCLVKVGKCVDIIEYGGMDVGLFI